jgi:hypothetical protein
MRHRLAAYVEGRPTHRRPVSSPPLWREAGWELIRESWQVLLEAPRGINVAAIDTNLHAVDGVQDVHDLHVWAVTSSFPTLSAHILVDRSHDCHERQHRVTSAALRHRSRNAPVGERTEQAMGQKIDHARGADRDIGLAWLALGNAPRRRLALNWWSSRRRPAASRPGRAGLCRSSVNAVLRRHPDSGQARQGVRIKAP